MLDIPINKTITNTVNFAEKTFEFLMLDAQRNGHMTGVLVDSAGKPLVQAPITIEFGQTKTWQERPGEGAVHSAIDLKTDSQGKFSCPVNLRYLYAGNKWVSVLAQVEGKKIKQSFNQLLKTGDDNSSKEISLENCTLRLDFFKK